MRHLTYLGVLSACLVGTAPLEIFLRARVYRRWRRTLLALLPAVVVFTAWDVAAIRAGWWHFDRRYVSGVFLPGRLPVEEFLFFIVVPVCAILTFEAVRRLQPTWPAGDDNGRARSNPARTSDGTTDDMPAGSTAGAADGRTDGTTDDRPAGSTAVRTDSNADGRTDGAGDGPTDHLARP